MSGYRHKKGIPKIFLMLNAMSVLHLNDSGYNNYIMET